MLVGDLHVRNSMLQIAHYKLHVKNSLLQLQIENFILQIAYFKLHFANFIFRIAFWQIAFCKLNVLNCIINIGCLSACCILHVFNCMLCFKLQFNSCMQQLVVNCTLQIVCCIAFCKDRKKGDKQTTKQAK